MQVELISDGAAARIDTFGAELRSLRDVFGTEYIWNANPRFWKRSSPVLFPFIGVQQNGGFFYESRFYAMPKHGFARDLEFTPLRSERSSALFALSDSEETRKVYPFPFRFEIGYALEGPALSVEYRVYNTGDGPMYFYIGGHTAYNCPLLPEERFEDYEVRFSQEEHTKRLLLRDDGMFEGTAPLFDGASVLPLNHELFSVDAVVPEKLRSRSVTLKSRRSGRGVQLDFDGFETCAVWSPRGEAPFVCLEPWNGRAPAVGENNELTEKPGILRLGAGETYRVSHRISLL